MNTKNNIAATVGTRSRASVIWRTAFAAAAFCVATAPSPSSAATLTHRWSFNGDLNDSVGGVNATIKHQTSTTTTVDGGTGVNIEDGKAVLTGGGGSGFLNLGAGVLGTGNAATIEVWARREGNFNAWHYVISYHKPDVGKCYTICSGRYNDVRRSNVAMTDSTGGGDDKLVGHPIGVTYHYSVTFTSSAVRTMVRNAETGALIVENTCVPSSWSLASAAADGWALTLGDNPWANSTMVANYSFDEVRVWDGVLSDEQLSANALAGPDSVVGGGASGITVAAGSTFHVDGPGGYGFYTSGAVTLETGAKISFDTASWTNFTNRSIMRFKAGSFALPAGASSVLDFVELSDSTHYTASLENTTTIKVSLNSSIPATSTWNGGTPTAASLDSAASWTSVDADGNAVSAAPGLLTTVVIPAGSTSFTIPAGYTPAWGRVVFGVEHPVTQCGRIASQPDAAKVEYIAKPLSAYTPLGAIALTQLNASGSDNQSGNFVKDYLEDSQLRFDGWINVTAAQSGMWAINCHFDDMFALLIDGERVLQDPRWDPAIKSGAFVSEGWHRFTLVCADTGGGYGSADFSNHPMRISINGSSSYVYLDGFATGSGSSTVTLAGDCDWSALGEIRISNVTTIDLQGHNLTLSDMTSDYIGTVITNSAAKKSVMYFLDEPLESKACSEGLVKEVDVKIILAKDGDQVATWTGAVSGDPSNANNWEDLAGEPVVPTAAYTVKVAGGNVNLQAPAGTDIACKSFEIGNCTLTANCDWRGLSKTPVIVGTANLNGHNLTLNRLSAVAGATLTGGDGSAVAFVPDESATVAKLSETAYIDNIANLTLSGDAKILFRKKDGNGTLTVTEMLLGNSLRSEVAQSAGTVSLGDKIHKIGDVAGKTGVYTLTNGTITTGGNSEFIIGSSGNGTFNMTGGTVTLGNWGSIARWENGNGTFNISGGTFNATKEGREIYMACANNTKGTLNASGNAILNLRGLWMGVWSSSTRRAYANFSENAVMNILGDIRIGSDTSTQGDITVRDNATINSTGAILLGRDGIGTLSLGGGTVNANSGVTIANGSGATGTLTLSGGVLNTKFLKKGGGKATTMFAGGKIVAKDASNAATFISGIGDVKYGAGGLTVDTAGYRVTMASNMVSYVSHGSALVKQGAGTLTVDALPPVDTVKVEGGTLALTADGDNAASASLAHRWSFNNDSKADSVTGDDAEFTSTITFVDGMARIPGGAKNDNYIELGSNRLPSDSVTMEFWVTIRADATWPKMFCLGASSSDVIGFTFHRDSNSGPSSIDVYPGGGMWTGTGTLTKDVPYYFAFTFLANPEDGSTVLKAYCVNTSTGALVGTINQTLANWRLAEKITQNMFRLGYSFWNDGAAQADYDEVRVWRGALSADAVALSATKGPDASADDIAAIVAKNGETVSADRTLAFAGGTLDLGGNTLVQPIVKGAGTVRNGTLKIADSIVVNLADCIAGNCLAASGTIDFTGATLVFEDPEVLATHNGSITFVKPAAGGSVTFVGVPECELPKGWRISMSGGKARIMKEGFSIFVR